MSVSAHNDASLDIIVEGPFTLFAPTDDAFKALQPADLIKLVADPKELKNTMTSHILAGTVYSRGLSTGKLHLARGEFVPVILNESMNGLALVSSR